MGGRTAAAVCCATGEGVRPVTESLTGGPRPGHPTLRGRHLGNFPQAFSHLALIKAVMHVIDGDERLSTGGPPATGLEGGTGLEAGAGAAADEAGS